MHDQGIIHRDMKPENILMHDDNTIKLADFGFAVALKGKPQQLILGSPFYMAPEVIQGFDYGSAVDIWAFGVIAYILLTGSPPFSGRTKPELQAAICYKKHKLDSSLSNEAIQLISSCLEKDQLLRPTAQ